MILAGSADFKTVLSANDVFDNRLACKILTIVDIAYGGMNGFNQAIELAGPVLGNVKFVQEKKVLGEYFDRIAQDTGTYCFGMDDTLKALEMGAVETLLCFEEMAEQRLVLHNSVADTDVVKILTQAQLDDNSMYKDPETGGDLEVMEKKSMVEWLCEHYKDYGANLEFVSNKSTE